jgi:hypothetical protein
MDRKTNGQKDKRTERQMDRNTNGQKDKWTYRQWDRQRNIPRVRKIDTCTERETNVADEGDSKKFLQQGCNA